MNLYTSFIGPYFILITDPVDPPSSSLVVTFTFIIFPGHADIYDYVEIYNTYNMASCRQVNAKNKTYRESNRAHLLRIN